MSRKLDWKELGKFFSVILSLFTVIRSTFTSQKIGLEIIDWMIGEGERKFIDGFLKPLGEEFLKAQQVIFVSPTESPAEISAIKHIIDCTVKPFTIDGWSIHEEDQLGSAIRASIEWNPKLIDLYVTYEQRTNDIVGHKLKKELKGKWVLTANVLDYLLENPNLIPEEWKSKNIFFWGTIYRSSFGNLFVCSLYWDGEQWRRNFYGLDSYFNASYHAALLANPSA